MLLKKPLRDFVRTRCDRVIDNQKVSCASIANGSPTIVFESGFCLGISCMKYWDSAFLTLSENYSVFAYDRVDEGLEGQEIEHIEAHINDTLHHVRMMLQAKSLNPPYILVGHSLGGLYSQHFAQRYPHEVAGVVLVDAVYPESIEQEDKVDNIDENIAKIAQALLLKPKLDATLPIHLLSALQADSQANRCTTTKMIETSIAHQKAYQDFYPFAKQTWVESGHLIQYEKPQVIVEAVKEISYYLFNQ
ncbi:MAG: alpha/beta hydrolase [Campylobacterota bacterium]|nr:alpha/beta hydrolase [Campylobacterota bacterium]